MMKMLIWDRLPSFRSGLLSMKMEQAGCQKSFFIKSHHSNANSPLDAFHQILGDIKAFHKAAVTFSLVLTLCLLCSTDCLYGNTVSSCSRLIEPLLQNIFPLPAGLSDNANAFCDELMGWFYWCVEANIMLTCFRYDSSCMGLILTSITDAETCKRSVWVCKTHLGSSAWLQVFLVMTQNHVLASFS